VKFEKDPTLLRVADCGFDDLWLTEDLTVYVTCRSPHEQLGR
jgi:hypothetical protein